MTLDINKVYLILFLFDLIQLISSAELLLLVRNPDENTHQDNKSDEITEINSDDKCPQKPPVSDEKGVCSFYYIVKIISWDKSWDESTFEDVGISVPFLDIRFCFDIDGMLFTRLVYQTNGF